MLMKYCKNLCKCNLDLKFDLIWFRESKHKSTRQQYEDYYNRQYKQNQTRYDSNFYEEEKEFTKDDYEKWKKDFFSGNFDTCFIP